MFSTYEYQQSPCPPRPGQAGRAVSLTRHSACCLSTLADAPSSSDLHGSVLLDFPGDQGLLGVCVQDHRASEEQSRGRARLARAGESW